MTRYGTTRRRGRPYLVRAAAAACVLIAGAPAARALDAGPLAVDAAGFEYLRHDGRTGDRTLAITAEIAEAVGDEARLRTVSLTRYRDGRPVLSATSRAGVVSRDADTVLEGGVEITWRGESAAASFRVASLRYERALGVVRSRSTVTGVVTGASAKDDDARDVRVVVDGNGLVLGASPGRGGGARVLRDVVLEVSGATETPWVISADGGVRIESDERSTALRFSGPVEGRSPRLVWSADDVELVLTEEPGGRLKLVRAFATGNVHASGEYGVAAGPQDGDDGGARFEARALAAEVDPEGGATFLGVVGDPACVAFRDCELRGTRVVMCRDRVISSGGATSVFRLGPRR